MDNIKKILAPTDLSKLSEAGVRYALNLARTVGAEVTIYHVVSYDEIMDYRGDVEDRVVASYKLHAPDQLVHKGDLALSRFIKYHFSNLTPQVKIREKVELGKAHQRIVEEANKEESDLIVMSTRGRTGLSHMFIGSVTEKVVRHAPCPVLSIHPQPEEQATQKVAAAG
ncbi:MAG: universal stress protein [Deltaproteobacteria bacterium]|nr:universal stress protein [Deltaproteobacteria bacterium]